MRISRAFVIFSLLFIASIAYAKPSTLVTAVPDETPTACPFPPTCEDRCPKITVNCIPSATDDFSSDPPHCIINVSAHVCAALGLCTGSIPNEKGEYSCTITHNQFRDLNQCKAAGAHSPTDAYRCCQLRHEYAHLCDPSAGGRGPESLLCTEVYAMNIDWQCMSDVVSTYCSGAGSGTWPPEDCLNFCTRLIKRTATKVWDACMCAKAVACGPVSGPECCSCRDECKAPGRVWNALPPLCRTILGSESSIYDTKIVPLCDGMPTGAHGCRDWNEELPLGFDCPPPVKATAVQGF